MMNTPLRNSFKQNLFSGYDLIIYAIMLIAALCVFAFSPSGEGAYVEVYSDGKLYGAYELSADKEILIESKQGYNMVVIKDNSVFVKEADCPGKDCVKHKAISKANQYIICTPNRLTVIIKGESEIDAYTGGER
jgi:hypothetical protein